MDLPNERLGVLDGGSDRNPSLVHRLGEIHSGDDVRHDQKDARFGERLARANSTAEPKHGVDLASGFKVHLPPEPLRLELFGFWV